MPGIKATPKNLSYVCYLQKGHDLSSSLHLILPPSLSLYLYRKKSCNMPESPFASDNESLDSTTTTSFSTAFQSIHAPPLQLRRKKTVTQLTRWVSKRISRSSMTDAIRGNELSEQNLNQLNNAINTEADGHTADKTNTDSSTASFVKEHKRTFERIDVIFEDPIPKPNLERERELRVRRSYAAFCEDFISSGPVSPKRVFDMTMRMDDCTEVVEQMEGLNSDPMLESQPISGGAMPLERDELSTPASFPLTSRMSETESTRTTCHPQKTEQRTIAATKRSLDKDEDFKPESPFTHCPPPPPLIMTPSVYKDMQRATRERKRARKHKLLGPFRTLFLKAPPL